MSTADWSVDDDERPETPWYRRWWALLLVLPAVGLALVGLLLFFVVFSRVPLPDDLGIGASVVLDVNGDEVGSLAAEVAREDVAVAEVPAHVPQAVLAAEDRGFYSHRGISATGVARALFTNARAGGVAAGGSTITQQYVKNALLTPERTYTRKVREAALAIKMEQAYEKDEILGFYLSSIYWGRGAYGIQAAARTYYGVDAAELDVNQAATLAGIIQQPERLDPVENPDGADARRRYVLDGMLSEGFIDQATHDELVAAGLPETSNRTGVARGPNAYYLDAVRRELGAILGEAQLFTGLTIRTQLDPRMQEAAQVAVSEAVAEGTFDSSALVAVDPSSGGVRALVGGPDISAQPFNVAVQGPRPVGSSFKAVTLAAFTREGHGPDSTYPAPSTITIGEYEGRNYDERDHGRQTVRDATRTSTNTVYLQMQEEIGRDAVTDTAVLVGLPAERAGSPTMTAQESLTLGPDSFTVLEMASAYGTFAAEGVRTTPHLVTQVTGVEGEVLFEAQVDRDRLLDQNVAAVVSDVLQDVITDGTGKAAAIGRPAAGKTGTTNDSKDAWFVGYVPQLSAAVWTGNLDNSPIEGGGTGGGTAAPIWARFMEVALEGVPEAPFPQPDLSQFEDLGVEQEACEEGFERREPPSEADENGWFPEVRVGSGDPPCVQVSPSPSPSPEPTETETEPSPQPTEPTVVPTVPAQSPSPSPQPTQEPTATEQPSPDATGGDGGGTVGGADTSTSGEPDAGAGGSG